MITIIPEYARHLYDLSIDGTKNAKLTGNSMKMLMLTLPFIVRDLIAEEVSYIIFIPCIYHVYTMYISCLTHLYPLLQVTLINAAIDRAKSGSLAGARSRGCTVYLTSLTPAMMSSC